MAIERRNIFLAVLATFLGTYFAETAKSQDRTSQQRELVTESMKRAATYYRDQVSGRGGYVYHYTLDLKTRWGEGLASKDQIWVQPPATPTVGMAYLQAYEATGDRFYLDAAKAAAEALVYGQVKSGGWRNAIDFDPKGTNAAQYRNGKGNNKGSNSSSLDDGQTQSALQFLTLADKALGFENATIHESVAIGFRALLEAQFSNGGFPQVWTGPVTSQKPTQANYPEYDWRTEGRIKNYWDMYTLNDNTTGYIAQALVEASHVYQDAKYKEALKRLGDFIILAQMPDPQPGWAQQYNFAMQPIWARKFEPPGVSGDETQEAIETLMLIYRETNDARYLAPIPKALQWLRKSMLPGNLLARYYELKTNRPLYMERVGEKYSLTYDDQRLPEHYRWKTESRVELLEKRLQQCKAGKIEEAKPSQAELTRQAASIVKQLDVDGRWVTTFSGERLVGQPKFTAGDRYLSSQIFSKNLTALAEFLQATK
ncbi:MAG: pectate lyase [Pirellulaceae bacterium]|nr:pectate lyase [Pirellulaceae bacterium]